MVQSLCILGRQPAIGLAELESLYGADKLQPLGFQAALINISPEQIEFGRLGGTMKLCRVIAALPTANWRDIEKHLLDAAPRHLESLPEGKLKLGLSAYGYSVSPKQLQITGLVLKKAIREHDRSVRVIPNEEPALGSAQVLHNNLTGPLGWELVLIKSGKQTVLAQTVSVQDITAYAKRDQARPKRDARIGMLPPKLAQTIINLANPPDAGTVLDPFCGTGVVLQEALMMGLDTCGTDIDPRMVEYSQANIEWLRKLYPNLRGLAAINQGDALNHQWPQGVSVVAAETYLGRPFSAPPAADALKQVVSDVNTIHRKFLHNLARQTEPGFRLCLAIPAWKTQRGFKHLPVLDHLTDMGYNRLSFVHVRPEDLIYHRPNQIVAREIVVMKRI